MSEKMNITEKQYDDLKSKAVKYFTKHRKINSASLWEAKSTPEWFNHSEWKNKNHKRTMEESFVRYLCFFHLEHILSNSKLYQEFRECFQDFEVKKNWKKVKQRKIVELYWFVAIVNNNKNRVKIVVKKVDWWNNYEFVSVIPVWKKNWYSWEMYFDNEEEFLESLIFQDWKSEEEILYSEDVFEEENLDLKEEIEETKKPSS